MQLAFAVESPYRRSIFLLMVEAWKVVAHWVLFSCLPFTTMFELRFIIGLVWFLPTLRDQLQFHLNLTFHGSCNIRTVCFDNFCHMIPWLTQDNFPSVMFAMVGGIVLSLGNLATQYAWAFVGLSVTEVVTASITVVIGLSLNPFPIPWCHIEFTSKNYSNAYSSHQLNSLCFSFLIGTTLNYFLDGKINKAEILFPGVGCFLIAVCLGSAVHASNASDNRAKLNGVLKTNEVEAGNGYTFFFLSLFGFWNFIKHLGLFYCEDNAYFA